MADYLTDAFIRLRQRLKLTSGRLLSDAGAAEDILQDSFVRLWRRQYPLKSEKEAEALLNKTVRNASLNERRRERTDPTIHTEGEGIWRTDFGRYCQRIEDGADGGKNATLPRPQNT